MRCCRSAVRRALTISLLGAALLAQAEKQTPADVLKGAGYESVSLRRTGQNHWFIFGSVDGRRRSCLVDTGWSYTAVSTNTAARLATTNQIGRLELGGLVLTNVPVRSLDLRVNGQATSYDVVLGCDFLVAHQAVIDFHNSRLYLRLDRLPPENRIGLEAVFRAGGWNEIEMKLLSPPALTSQATIREVKTELLMDSGAMWSCLDQQLADEAGLRMAVSANRLSGPGANGQRGFAVTDLKTWSLGSVSMSERTFAVLDISDWGLGSNGKLFPQVKGILGGAELITNCAWMDCGSLKLWVKPRR